MNEFARREPDNAGRSLAYQPALDGLRAVSVILVVLFHAGLGFVSAGYLGVSVFFTISGYLITTLLLVEHRTTGAIRLGAFYGRRLKRLLPASVLCIFVVVVASQFGAFGRVDGLRGDVAGAVLQVFNWVRLAGDTSYGAIFGGAVSPLEHYWSLAIEEQFYWLWPLVLIALLRVSKHRVVTWVVGLTLAFSAGAVVIAQVFGPDAAYWATPARLPEILTGAVLACVLAGGWTVPANAARLAPIALAVIVALSCTLPSGRGLAYEGALPAFALVSALLIYALQVPGFVRRLLSARPLVFVGRISYGLYLFHWPVFVLLRDRGWNLTRLPDLAAALAITMAIAMLSSRIIERPVRASGWRPLTTLRLGALASTVALLSTVVVPPSVPFIQADGALLDAAGITPIDPAERTLALVPVPAGAVEQMSTTTATATLNSANSNVSPPDATTPDAATTTATITTTTTTPIELALPPAPARPVRILVAGDSTALYVAEGLAAWSLQHPLYAQLSVRWCEGCTFLLEPEITTFDLAGVIDASRRTIGENLPAAVQELRPDVVMLMVTVNDVSNREWSAEEGPLGPLDPRFRERLRTVYGNLTMQLLADGVPNVLWVVPPTPFHLWLEPEMNEPARYAAQHDVIRDVASLFDQRVTIVDLDAWLTAAGHTTDPWWRADGVHLTDESAALLAEQYLGPLVVARALKL